MTIEHTTTINVTDITEAADHGKDCSAGRCCGSAQSLKMMRDGRMAAAVTAWVWFGALAGDVLVARAITSFAKDN